MSGALPSQDTLFGGSKGYLRAWGERPLELEEAKEKWLFGFLSVWVREGIVTPGDALQGAWGPQCRALMEQPWLTQRAGALPASPWPLTAGASSPRPRQARCEPEPEFSKTPGNPHARSRLRCTA